MSSMQYDNRPRENGIDQRPDEVVDSNRRIDSQSVVQRSIQDIDPNKGKHYSSTGLEAHVAADDGVSASQVAQLATHQAHNSITELVASGHLSPAAASEYRLQVESDIARKVMGIDADQEQDTQAKNRPSPGVLEQRNKTAEKGSGQLSERTSPLTEVAREVVAEKKQSAGREAEPSTIAPVEGIFLHSARAPAEQVEKAVAKVLQAHEKKGREAESFLEKLQAAGQKVDAMGVPVISASFQVERNKRGELVDL